jgi:hypothetical protein
VCTSRIMRHLFDVQDEAIGLFHFIRIWLFYNDIKMKRFVQAMLVIFFLQRKKYMPTVKRILKNVTVKRVDGKLINQINIVCCTDILIYQALKFNMILRAPSLIMALRKFVSTSHLLKNFLNFMQTLTLRMMCCRCTMARFTTKIASRIFSRAISHFAS